MNKQQIITKIQTIIKENGEVSIAETGESCPVLKRIAKNEYILIEGLYLDTVFVSKYVHEIEINNWLITYKELTNSLLKEILEILKTHLGNGYESF